YLTVYPVSLSGLGSPAVAGNLVMISPIIWNAVSGWPENASLIGSFGFMRTRTLVIALLISCSATARVSAPTAAQSWPAMRSTSARAERRSSSCAMSRRITSPWIPASACSNCSACQRSQARLSCSLTASSFSSSFLDRRRTMVDSCKRDECGLASAVIHLACEERVRGREQLNGELSCGFLVTATEVMKFLPLGRFDDRHRNVAARDHRLD